MMRGKFKNRWIMVGLVWACVLMIHFWNIEKIDQIRELRAQREIFLRDQQFWNNNAKNISQILQQYSSFTQHTESLKLGLLQLENNLKASALGLGLKEVKFISQTETAGEGIVPVKLVFNSTFKDASQWLDKIQKDLPCVWIQNIKVSLEPLAEQAKFQVSINYRYTLSFAESAA
jgi:hypothetical protein